MNGSGMKVYSLNVWSFVHTNELLNPAVIPTVECVGVDLVVKCGLLSLG